MKSTTRSFSTEVHLPCRVFCGPDELIELSGTAITIDSGGLELTLPQDGRNPCPVVGEQIHLEVLLPGNHEHAAARCLMFRATVVQAKEAEGGSRRLVVSFRKAAFKDVENGSAPKVRKAAENGWEM